MAVEIHRGHSLERVVDLGASDAIDRIEELTKMDPLEVDILNGGEKFNNNGRPDLSLTFQTITQERTRNAAKGSDRFWRH